MNYPKVHQTWFMLKITYAIVPIIIGLDKLYTWWLVDWSKYVSPLVLKLVPLDLITLNRAVGVVEIIAGLIVWFYPRWGGYLVAAWLLLVVTNLLSMNMFYDIAARDVVLAIGAVALAWLTEAQE